MNTLMQEINYNISDPQQINSELENEEIINWNQQPIQEIVDQEEVVNREEQVILENSTSIQSQQNFQQQNNREASREQDSISSLNAHLPSEQRSKGFKCQRDCNCQMFLLFKSLGQQIYEKFIRFKQRIF